MLDISTTPANLLDISYHGYRGQGQGHDLDTDNFDFLKGNTMVIIPIYIFMNIFLYYTAIYKCVSYL